MSPDAERFLPLSLLIAVQINCDRGEDCSHDDRNDQHQNYLLDCPRPMHGTAHSSCKDGNRIDVHKALQPLRQRSRIDKNITDECQWKKDHEADRHQ